jgi:hypothetical protein
LGEGSWVKSKDGTCLDVTGEDISTLDITFAWRDLVLMTEEECLCKKWSRNYTCSVIVLCVKRPLAVTSRHRLASIPTQKRRNNTPLGKDKSGPACTNAKNLS